MNALPHIGWWGVAKRIESARPPGQGVLDRLPAYPSSQGMGLPILFPSLDWPTRFPTSRPSSAPRRPIREQIEKGFVTFFSLFFLLFFFLFLRACQAFEGFVPNFHEIDP